MIPTYIINHTPYLHLEEWRKRYEKQKEECDRLKAAVQIYVAELNRWRQGRRLYNVRLFFSYHHIR